MMLTNSLPMPSSTCKRYSFGEFTLDVDERRLSSYGVTVHLAPKAFDLLLALVQRPGQLVSKRDLLQIVWADTFVEEGILTVYMATLRKELGDTSRPPSYLETVPRFGYRFVATVFEGVTASRSDETHPVESIELVAKGRSDLLTGSYVELRAAIDAFEAAIQLDSSYAPAHAGLALARCAQAENRTEPAQWAHEQAKCAALRALALDDRSADAQLALATVLLFAELDWRGAERSLRRTIEIDPNYPEAYIRYGNLLEALGRLDEALAMKRRAFDRQPTSALVLAQVGVAHWCRHEYDQTLEWAQRALAVDPKHAIARTYAGFALWKLGKWDLLTGLVIEQAELFGVPVPSPAAQLEVTHGESDDLTRWPNGVGRSLLQPLEQKAAGKSAGPMAVWAGERGELDVAFRYLDQAIDERYPGVIYLGAPQWDTLRRDPRFAERLTRVGLPPHQPHHHI
jgi:DNA-binding winged helix-turn-helix (wHTH) protein/Flp pilus assembly protein TadD